MKRNSKEIEELLFNKQIDLYIRIDNLINKQFDELEADVMSVLTRTLMDLEDRIQLYKKELEKREMYGNTFKERNNLNQLRPYLKR
jgi:hypothetical protein